MDPRETLRDLGLSEGEARIYLTLLRIGEAKVGRINQETKMHRTTIYDFLDALLKKGLVSFVVKNNIKFYSAAHPSQLSSLVKEKEEKLQEAMQQLLKMAEAEKKALKVEVYEGVEGFKTALNNILREETKEFLGFGIDETKFEEKFPHIMKTYFRKEQKAGITERMITRKGAKFVYKYPHIRYRYLEDKFFDPTPTLIFGNKVGFLIWEPLAIIIIDNKELATAYRKYFDLMWTVADKSP